MSEAATSTAGPDPEVERLRGLLEASRSWRRMRDDRALIARLTAERDEARRELCHAMCNQPLHSYRGQTPVEIAYYQGWDCFMEGCK